MQNLVEWDDRKGSAKKQILAYFWFGISSNVVLKKINSVF